MNELPASITIETEDRKMKITIEADNIAEFNSIIFRFADGVTSAAPKSVVAGPGSDKPKDLDKPKADAKEAPKEAGQAKADDKVEISYAKHVAPRVLKLAEAKGREAAIAVMAKFGVTKAPQLNAAQYPEFIKALDAALNAE